MSNAAKRILVLDIGGTNVKMIASGALEPRAFPSGLTMTPRRMVAKVLANAKDWRFDMLSIGYPGPVIHGRIAAEPHNLKAGWVGFDFHAAFKKPVRIINDAAMQALGSYRTGSMLFLGLGTGLGSAMIIDGMVEPMELGHLPYRKATYEDYVGERGLERLGKKRWRRHVAEVVELLRAALRPDEVVLGGGNVRLLREPPEHARAVANANAFIGGFRLWNVTAGPAATSAR
jgi:polyphosphate glucokinase